MVILKFHPGIFFSFFHPGMKYHPCLSPWDESSSQQKRVNSHSWTPPPLTKGGEVGPSKN